MNIRPDKILTVLTMLITVKHKACISIVLKSRLAQKMYSKSWFVKKIFLLLSCGTVLHSLASQFPAMDDDNICANCLNLFEKK